MVEKNLKFVNELKFLLPDFVYTGIKLNRMLKGGSILPPIIYIIPTEGNMMIDDSSEKKSFLFKRLVLTFHTAAMQQMGKLADPFSGKIIRNLEQAAISIDTLDMLFEYCGGNISEEDSNFLEHLLGELKLNYVDEVGRPDPEHEKPDNEKNSDATSEEPPKQQEEDPKNVQ